MPERTFHERLLTYCDFYVFSDLKKEIFNLPNGKMCNDTINSIEDDSLRYLALNILWAITNKVHSFSFERDEKGKDQYYLIQEKEAERSYLFLKTGEKIFEIMHSITHIDSEIGKGPVTIGLQNDSLELDVRFESNKDMQTIIFSLPNLY